MDLENCDRNNKHAKSNDNLIYQNILILAEDEYRKYNFKMNIPLEHAMTDEADKKCRTTCPVWTHIKNVSSANTLTHSGFGYL